MSATAIKSSKARDRPDLALKRASPIHEARRQEREQRVSARQSPQGQPIARNVAQARAHLVDADKAVDRGCAGKDAARQSQTVGYPFQRPGDADQKKQRQAGRDEQQHRGLAALEPGSHELRQEADGQHERDSHEEQFEWIPQGREAVDPRQDDEVERQSGRSQAEMRQRLTENRADRAARASRRSPTPLKRNSSKGSRPHEKRLLQDQYERGRDDVTRIAAGRVEERLAQKLDRRARDERSMRETSVNARAPGRYRRVNRLRGAGDPFPDAAVDKEIRGIDVGGDPGLLTLQNVTLSVFRDDDDAEHAPLIERPSRLRKIGWRLGDLQRLVRFERLNEFPAELGVILVDDGDRQIAQKLP